MNTKGSISTKPETLITRERNMPQISPNVNAQPPAQVILKEDDKMPLFLIKLWNIVEDPNYYDVIRWDESGYSFHILDPYSFCRNVLPQYFKHNNLNSLIRQLNMYGFRKMTPIERTSLARAESDQDHLEFSHPCFVRDHPELLTQIKRKTPNTKKDDSSTNVKNQDLTGILDEIRQLRSRQSGMEERMSDLVNENHALWQQLDTMRATHNKQQQIVNKLVHFLVALVQPKRLNKRHMFAIDEASSPKKTKMNSGSEQSNALQVIESNNVNDILDNLIHDFKNRNFDKMKSDNNTGPIISDVTDELDHLTTSNRLNNDFIIQPENGVNFTSTATNGQHSNQNMRQNQQPQVPQQQTRGGPYYHNQMPSRVPNISQNASQQQQQPPLNNVPIQDPSLAMINSTEEPFVLSPNGQLPFNANDFADYLNGVDQGIDTCRDLIGDQWNNFDFDSLIDCANESPEEHYQQPLSLEQMHPVYNYSPPNMQPGVSTTVTNNPSPVNRIQQQGQQQKLQTNQHPTTIPSSNNYQQQTSLPRTTRRR